MKKDKLITIRVTEETRDNFNIWCETNKIKSSTFLSNIIEQCIQGIISPDLTSQSIVNQNVNHLEERINSLSEKIKNLDEKYSQRFLNLESRLNEDKVSKKRIDKRIVNDIRTKIKNIPTGIIIQEELSGIFGISETTLRRIISGERKNLPYPEFWEDFEVKKEKGKKKIFRK